MAEAKKSAVNLLTECLAAMTCRAIEAERKLDEANQSTENWYRNFQTKNKQLEEANQQIVALLEKLAEAEKKGAPDNE